ncbi:unnamed protein product [Polarella glacialis]|uniref:Uncharacterized protein n=1 Tax=Polarella glacialis TaxID=89957 RepID=A0A813K641_POLGL|nr:unnamed protein product [Polarella glacialis]
MVRVQDLVDLRGRPNISVHKVRAHIVITNESNAEDRWLAYWNNAADRAAKAANAIRTQEFWSKWDSHGEARTKAWRETPAAQTLLLEVGEMATGGGKKRDKKEGPGIDSSARSCRHAAGAAPSETLFGNATAPAAAGAAPSETLVGNDTAPAAAGAAPSETLFGNATAPAAAGAAPSETLFGNAMGGRPWAGGMQRGRLLTVPAWTWSRLRMKQDVNR